MAKITIGVSLTASQYEEMYRGSKKHVIAHSSDGRRVRLPLLVFQKFITHEGLHGIFEVEFDEHNKLVNLEKRH